MSEQKDNKETNEQDIPTRLSFSMDKIPKNEYKVGKSGITATTTSGAEPTFKPKYSEKDGYSSSELLNRNIDDLAKKLNLNCKLEEEAQEEIFDEEEIQEEIVTKSNSITGLTEEQVIEDLDYYISLTELPDPNSFDFNKSLAKPVKIKVSNKKDNFCRNCGVKFTDQDNFCANCGSGRN